MRGKEKKMTEKKRQKGSDWGQGEIIQEWE